MSSIRPSGPGAVSAVSGGGGAGKTSGASLAEQALSAGMSEGFPQGPLSELLRYPDERQRSRQDALDLADEAADEHGLDFSDKAALARSMAALVEATTTYSAEVYRIAIALLASSDSEAVDVVHDTFGSSSWRERLDEAVRPMRAVGLSAQTAQEFIGAIETAARQIETARKALPKSV
jgi:hypothetical protein